MYVDNWLSRADSVFREACKLLSEGHSIMSDASMTLTKWHTNNIFFINEYEQLYKNDVGVTKLLGMYWNPSEDVFSFKVSTWMISLIAFSQKEMY